VHRNTFYNQVVFNFELFKNLRKEKRLTLRDLAKEIHLSPSYLNQIENGTRLPSLRVVEKLASFYNLSPGEFFLREEKRAYRAEDPIIWEIVSYLRRLPQNYRKLVLEFVRFQHYSWKRKRKETSSL